MNNQKKESSIAILILALGFLLIPLISYIRFIKYDYNYPPMTAAVRIPAVLIFCLLFFGYWIYIKKEDFSLYARIKPVTMLAVFSLGIFLSAIAPIFSIDLYEYIIRGRIVTIYHANPYMHAPIEFGKDIFFNIPTAKIFWEKSTMIYGPVWTYIISGVTSLGRDSIFINLFLAKFTLFLFHVLSSFFIYKIAKELKLELPAKAAYVYLLNPFILVVTVIDGHLDASMVCFLLGSLYLLCKERFYLSFFMLSLAVMTKYFPILVIPFYALYINTRIPDKKIFFKKLFISFAIFSLTLVAAYYPFSRGFKVFSEFKSVFGGIDTTTFAYIYQKLLYIILPNLSLEAFRYICYAFFGFVYLSLLIFFAVSKRNKIQLLPLMILAVFSAYVLFAAFQLNPWYLVMIVPFILISPVPDKYFLMWLISFASLIAFWKRISFLLIIAIAVYCISLLKNKGNK